MPTTDPFQNIFGTIRIFIDKIQELENQGFVYGLRNYLRNAIIVTKDANYPMLIEVYIPGFLFYFQFVIDKDQKTNTPYIADFAVRFPIAGEEKND